MGFTITCGLCGRQEKGMHPDCGCPERETAKNVQKKQWATILEAILEEDGGALYLYEKLITQDFEIFYMRTCLRSVASGEYEDHRKIVEVLSTEFDDVFDNHDWPGVENLNIEESIEKTRPVGIDDLEAEGPFDDTKFFPLDTRKYIFEQLSETTARFRRWRTSDDPDLIIPIHYLDEERENKADCGWEYSHATKDEEFWVCTMHKSVTNPFVAPKLPSNYHWELLPQEEEPIKCCLPPRPKETCTAPARKENVCSAHKSSMPTTYSPPNGYVFTLEECGRSRVPISENNEGAKCGVSIIKKGFLTKPLYCTAPANHQSQAGTWTCKMHTCRRSCDAGKVRK
jgi:hypothetical protein